MTSDIESPQPPSQPAAAPEARPNSFGRIAGALFSPNQTFADIARKPDILVPLAVLIVIGFVAAFLMAPRMDFESAYRDAMQASGQEMPAEDQERAVRMMTAFGKTLTYFSPVIGVLWFLVVAGVLLLAVRLFGGEGNFKQAFSVTLYSWFPITIGSLLTTAVVVSKKSVPADQVSTVLRSHLGFLAHPKEQMVLHALLSSLDIFVIWTLILLIIGFSFVSKMSKAKTAAVVLSLWLVMVVIKVGLAAIGAAKMKAS